MSVTRFMLLWMTADQLHEPNLAAVVVLVMDQLPATCCMTRIRLQVQLRFLYLFCYNLPTQEPTKLLLYGLHRVIKTKLRGLSPRTIYTDRRLSDTLVPTFADSSSVVVKALCCKPEGRRFETR
jgi:hypothetical protein